MRSLLFFLFLLELPLGAQADLLHPGQLKYVAHLGQADIGQETITLSGQDWVSK